MKSFALRSLAVAVLLVPTATFAVEEDFVGVLALAVDGDVAQQLGLTDDQKQKLLELIDTREEAALELALELRDLSESERTEKLGPFRRQSEALGLAILDAKQRRTLEQLRLRRKGLAALGEAGIADKLKLSDTQQEQVAAILASRAKKLAETGGTATHIVRSTTQRELAAVLNDSQKTAWESLTTGGAATGLPATELAAATPPTPPSTPESDNPFEAGLLGPPKEPGAEDGDTTAQEDPTEQESESEDADATEETNETTEDPAEEETPKEVKLRFNFRFQPWKDVLDWFAQQADLSLVLDAPPPGTFNYSDNREYTPAEAIDLINSVLLTKGYTLLRRGRMLMVINLEDGIPPNLVSTIPLEDLDKKGEYELIAVLFTLNKMSSEEAEAEINKLIGPQGSLVPLPKSRQILVTETAGRLRAIRSVIQRVEDPQGLAGGQLQSYELKHALPGDVTAVMRQLLDIPEDRNAAADGSIRFAMDPLGGRLLVTGKPDMVIKVDEIVKAVDVPAPGDADAIVQEQPQLEVYAVTTADPQAALAVMQTLMAGQPDVRLAIDEKTGNLVALARPSQHATIRATLDQMQRDARLIEVIRLQVVDPQLAVLSINKLFGGTEEAAAKNAPTVDADPTTGQLLIRGTQSQIDQIRSLLNKMGETESDETIARDQSNVRMLPLTGQSADTALERIQEIWPTMRSNKIRVVTPSSSIPSVRPGSTPDAKSKSEIGSPAAPLLWPGLPLPPDGAWPLRRPEPKSEAAPSTETPPAKDKSAHRRRGPRVIFAAQQVEKDAADAAPGDSEEATTAEPESQAPRVKSVPGAAIIVAPGPGGIMIASEDIEALNDFEDLLTTLASSAMAGSSEMTIFYLKHAKAQVVAETLDAIFGGGTITTEKSGGGGGGGLLGDLAGAAMGDSGGILGSLLGMGGGGTIAPSGSLQITPDLRLNALIVQANPTDVATIEELLRILDQKESPEDILVAMKARVIPVLHTGASEIADILKQVYRDRMVASTSGAGAQRPSPQQFMQMLRGGRRGSGGSSRSSTENVQKMSVSVDERTNSLIVGAPEQLFEEVKELVAQLDQAAVKSGQTTNVVTLQKASPEAVQQALSAMFGDSVKIGKTTSSKKPTATPRPSSSSTRTTPTPRPPSSSSRTGSSFRRPSIPSRPSTSSSRSRR